MKSSIPITHEISIELLRKDLPKQYRLWVLGGVLVSLVGYLSTTITHLYMGSGTGIFAMADPYIVIVDLAALALLRGNWPRTAAGLWQSGPAV